MYEPKGLSDHFQRLEISKKLSYEIGENVVVDPANITCLKSNQKMSVYKLFLQKKTGDYPVILKIYHSDHYKNEVEIKVYDKAYHILKEFLPRIYYIEKNKSETWIFMEFVHQVRGQITFTPAHFDSIIPSVAKLHAHMFEGRFKKHNDVWKGWLPIYESDKMKKDRVKYINRTITLLHAAVEDERLKKIVRPHYKSLMKIYQKGPDFFPELIENGSSITHGDLHMQNICSNHINSAGPWKIQFIDWESAKYAPVWFDMVVLVEILLGFRKDWQSNAEEIRTHCVKFYTEQMKKNSVTFKTNPMDLYKMAYLQRTLEKGLHTQLRRIFDNRGGELLPYHLERVSTWGKEFGL
ncbi:phosphotransferase [Bacillus sp. C1]